jgi:hypothetical protein
LSLVELFSDRQDLGERRAVDEAFGLKAVRGVFSFCLRGFPMRAWLLKDRLLLIPGRDVEDHGYGITS